MITIPILLITVILPSPFQCVQYLDEKTTNRPVSSTVSMRTVTRSMIELHESHVLLTCNDSQYTAHLITTENKPF